MIADFRNNSLKKFYYSEIADLRSLPIPDRKLIQGKHYAPVTAVQATRGCPNACKFCSISAFFNHHFRARPVEHVIEEIEPLGRHLLFMDDNITADSGYAKELFTKMIPLKKRWYSQCSVSIAYDNELLDLAYRSGCRGLFLGLESLSERNLQQWSKGTNKARDYEKVIQKIHRKGIAIYAGIVFGYDSDIMDIFSETLEFLLRNNIDALQATILTPFPGTPLHEEMEQQGRILDHDWSHYNFGHVVFEPLNMSSDDLKQGHDWVLNTFYSLRMITRRTIRGFGYLGFDTAFQAILPLNIAYRSRLITDGTIE
jgi:radical SAM superfamily enzyme YgiQ (UPF0313 family)